MRNSFHGNDSDGDYEPWDRFGRTKFQRWYKYSATTAYLDEWDYTYDYAGNRLTRDIPSSLYATDDLDQTFAHDGLQRLANQEQGTLSSGSITSKSFAQEFTLDQLGNWEEFKQDSDGNGNYLGATDFDQDRAHNAVNELGTISGQLGQSNWADPVHDAAGNMTTMPRPKDPASSYAATYDAWNRLVAVGSVQANEYDGLHRRILRDETGGSGDKRHFYYNNKWQVIEERVEVSGTIDPDPLLQNLWHPYYIDALALRAYDDDLDGSIQYHFFTHDANFNVTALYTVSGTFNARERYIYSPYGEVTYLHGDFSKKTTQASSYGNEDLYTGRKRDPETALYDFRTRFYHAELGKFTSRDWIGYGGGMNLSGYVGGMPTGFVDPFGLLTFGWQAGIDYNLLPIH